MRSLRWREHSTRTLGREQTRGDMRKGLVERSSHEEEGRMELLFSSMISRRNNITQPSR